MRFDRLPSLALPAAFLVLCGVGCQSYRPQPLVPLEILREVEEARNLLAEPFSEGALSGGAIGDEALPAATFEAQTDQRGTDQSSPEGGLLAAAWLLSVHSPALHETRARYHKLHGVASIATPFPNPTIAAGPEIGFDLDDEGSSRRIQPMIEFGFTVPLSRRLTIQDDLNAALAEAARIDLVVRHREEYLRLRELYAERVLAGRGLTIQQGIWKSALRSLDLAHRLAQAGYLSQLDVGILKLEGDQREAEVLRSEAQTAAIEQELAALIGVAAHQVRKVVTGELPAIDAEIPALEQAKAILVANNPELARLRSRHEVAEQTLRLEIAKQYPDLEIGTSIAGDPGETKKVWGLGLGLALPLFDRNRQGIADAEGERAEVRAAYEAALNRLLAALEGSFEAYRLATMRWSLLEGTILPQARTNLDVALQAIQAGTIDSLKYLEVERTTRSYMVDLLESEREIREIMSHMEQIMGTPLSFFPGENLGNGADDSTLRPFEDDKGFRVRDSESRDNTLDL